MPQSSSPPEWRLESSERLHQYEMFGVRHDRARSPESGEVRDFHVAESPGGVVVLAFTRRNELVAVEQYRHGIRSVTLEAPSGVVDEGEDPLAAGMRELREETGFEAARGTLLATFSLNPSWQNTRVSVVLARDVERTADKELDEAEDTRVRLVPWGRVRELLREGRLDAGATLSALGILLAYDPELAWRGGDAPGGQPG